MKSLLESVSRSETCGCICNREAMIREFIELVAMTRSFERISAWVEFGNLHDLCGTLNNVVCQTPGLLQRHSTFLRAIANPDVMAYFVPLLVHTLKPRMLATSNLTLIVISLVIKAIHGGVKCKFLFEGCTEECQMQGKSFGIVASRRTYGAATLRLMDVTFLTILRNVTSQPTDRQVVDKILHVIQDAQQQFHAQLASPSLPGRPAEDQADNNSPEPTSGREPGERHIVQGSDEEALSTSCSVTAGSSNLTESS
ncbi:hypothetical protein FBEOM_1701 [Fusarium beomiforme]|uniref:Uncharacterized protein n=1 Tax=Fusarium beomiforme TaxID=44412 RepID=A0A9P5E0L4_9HYPO|nr:hypothetical protein FBEOM_1701 [Fusarium beomiforme]